DPFERLAARAAEDSIAGLGAEPRDHGPQFHRATAPVAGDGIIWKSIRSVRFAGTHGRDSDIGIFRPTPNGLGRFPATVRALTCIVGRPTSFHPALRRDAAAEEDSPRRHDRALSAPGRTARREACPRAWPWRISRRIPAKWIPVRR